MPPTLAWHRSQRWLYAPLLAVGIMLVPISVSAARPSIEGVHLQYSAARTCPSDSEFVSALRRDSDPFELVAEDDARWSVDVDLQVLGESARGRFRVVDRGRGTTTLREITGPDCEAVARALALMLALTMHRLSESGPSDQSSAGAPEPAEPPAEPPHEERVPAATPNATGASDRRPVPTTRVPSPRGLALSLDLQVELSRAVIREVLPFAAMTFQVQLDGWGLRPALGLSVRQSLPTGLGVAGGEAKFVWTAGAIRACPHVFVVGALDVAPCLEAGFGLVRADASGLPAARSSTRAWREGTALVAERWHVSDHWFLATTAFVTVPLTRNRFELASGALISQAPVLGLGAGLGAGLEL